MFTIREYQDDNGRVLRYGVLTPAIQSEAKPEANGKAPAASGGGRAAGRAMVYVPGLGGSVKNAMHFLSLMLTTDGPEPANTASQTLSELDAKGFHVPDRDFALNHPGFDVIYGPDLIGFGLNQPEPDEDTVHRMAPIMHGLEAFLKKVVEPARHTEVVLCGISLGGVAATLMAVERPERFSHLILLAPAYKPHPQAFSLEYTLRTTLTFLLRGGRARATLPYGITSLTTNQAILDNPQYKEKPHLSLPPDLLLCARALCKRAAREVSQLILPTLIVIPGRDTVCDPTAMRQAFHQIPATTAKACLEYPDFYHGLFFEEEAPTLAREMLAWLYSDRRGSSTRDSCSAISSSR